MRIAINAVSFEMGSAVTVLHRFLDEFRTIGASVDIALYASRRSVLDHFATSFPRSEVIPFALEQSSALHFLAQQTRLGSLVDRSGADVLWTTHFGLARCETPQLVHHRNLLYFLPTRALRSRVGDVVRVRAARRSLARAAANVFVSAHMLSAAERISRSPHARNYVVPNPLPPALLDIAMEERSRGRAEGLLLAVQTPYLHKDFPTLVKVLERLRAIRPNVPWRLVVAGYGNWKKEKALVSNDALGACIDFVGYLGEKALSDLYESSMCLLHPSRCESFGNALTEAMAHGCPVVAARAAAVPEVLGGAGILVEPGDYKAFAAAILELIDSPSLSLNQQECGRRRSLHFRGVDSATQMLRILDACASGP